MKSKCGFLMAAVVFAICGLARADVEAAKGYVKEASDLIASNDFSGAASKLELAEAELDGVDAGAKAPVDAQIKEIKAKIAGLNASVNKTKYTRELTNLMSDAEGSIGNLVTWGGIENQFNELLANPDAQAAIGPELDAAKKKFATFKKLNDKKAGAAYSEQAEAAVKQVEEEWAKAKPIFADPDASPNSKSSAIDDISRSVESARKQVGRVPDDRSKSMFARLDAISAEFTQVALAGKTQEVVETLNRQIDLYKDDFEGYEKETTGPTWDQYTHEQNENISSFGAPKTKVYISRMDGFLENLQQMEDYKTVSGAPAVKAIVEKTQANRDAAYKKMLSLVTPVVEAAEKSPTKDESNLSRLKDDVRLALGEKSPEGLAMQAQLEKKISGNAAAAAGADAAKGDMIVKLHAKAEEVWPSLREGITVVDGPDFTDLPGLTGKTVSFTADNLMGYRFKPGDFYFATTLGGTPVAAKIPAELMNGIKAIEEKMGRSLGDSDDDGKWEVLCVITDRHVKLMAKRQAEATGQVDGVDVKITGEYAEPVEATVIEFVAAKCGPFAGAKDKGVLKPDGSIGK